MKKAVYPGSFDPVTNGHLDVIKRISRIFDEVIVAIVRNPRKKMTFTLEERLEMMEKAVSNLKNVKVVKFDGLLVNLAKKLGCNIVIRGLRAVTDFEFEFQMALMNKELYNEMETFFIMTNTEYQFLTSTVVKEIFSLSGDVSKFVPECVIDYLKNKFL